MQDSMEVENPPLGGLDVLLFLASLSISVVIGLFFANKNKTMEEFMLGGRSQKLLPVAISMMTSFLSGLTLIGNPAELYYHGPYFSTAFMGTLLSIPFSAFILLPVFYRLESISIYSYLELRFHPSVKKIVSIMFMLQMTLYNAVVLYVPSLSLRSVFDISEIVSIGAVGISCLLYSTIGGIKAVIWTDFFQAGLMYLAMTCIVIFGTLDASGISNLWFTASEGGRLSFDNYFKFDLTTRHTIYTMLTGPTVINIFMNGCNQIQVQRALSLPSLRLAQWSQFMMSLFIVMMSLLSSYIGLILYSTYKDCDPYESGQIDKRDTILIYYVYSRLASIPGIRGVFVAGIFAATLSTLSSFQNSMAALLLEDIVKPIVASRSNGKQMSEQNSTRLSKIFSLLFGLSCIGLTFVVGRFSGLLQAAFTLFGALGAPFLGAFYMGMLSRFVNTIGVVTGMLAGFTFGLYVQIYQMFYMPALEPSLPISTAGCPANLSTLSGAPMQRLESMAFLHQDTPMTFTESIGMMSYQWLPVIALIITSIVAIIVSLLTGGWNQQVDNKYLVRCLHKRAPEFGQRSKYLSKNCF